jgi:hypothetical protein
MLFSGEHIHKKRYDDNIIRKTQIMVASTCLEEEKKKYAVPK